MKRILWNKYSLVALVFLTAGFFYSIKSANKKAKRAQTSSTVTVEKQTVVERVTISGFVAPERKTLITAPYKGYIRKLFVKLGSDIQAGAPVASVVTSLSTNEEVFPLRAPFAGKVVQLNKAEGEFVKEADPTDFIARIDDLSHLYIDANVGEMDRIKIKIGQEAVVKASAILSRSYKGIVKELSFAAKDKDRWERGTGIEFPIRLEIMDFDSQIQPGMSVLLDIISQKKENVLFLRHEYILKDKNNYYVTLADGEKKEVEIGLQNEEGCEITNGLEVGDKVRKVDFSKLMPER